MKARISHERIKGRRLWVFGKHPLKPLQSSPLLSDPNFRRSTVTQVHPACQPTSSATSTSSVRCFQSLFWKQSDALVSPTELGSADYAGFNVKIKKVNQTGGTETSSLLVDSYEGMHFTLSSVCETDANIWLVVPQGGSTPAFKSTGSDQAAHDSSFKSFINGNAAGTLKNAVTKKLEDVSGVTSQRLQQESDLLH